MHLTRFKTPKAHTVNPLINIPGAIPHMLPHTQYECRSVVPSTISEALTGTQYDLKGVRAGPGPGPGPRPGPGPAFTP